METVRTFLLWFPSSTSSNVLFVLMVSVVGLLMVSVVAGNVCVWFPSLVFDGFRRGRNTFFNMVSVVGFSMDSAIAGGFNILERIERFLVLIFV